MRPIVATLLLLLGWSSVAAAAPPDPPLRPYHLELQLNPGAPFPFLAKLGTISLHVYARGIRAESLLLNGFSRNGASTITIENPLSRMYADMPLNHLASMTSQAAKYKSDIGNPTFGPKATGKVGGVDAVRYRLVYGAEAWIDVWTTQVIPENPQLRLIVNEFVRGVSPTTEALARTIPGTPLYVELNFRRYKKLPIVKLEKLTFEASGEKEALSGGSLYFRAPLPDSVWK